MEAAGKIDHISRVSCQKGSTPHSYAWQIGPFWQDTFNVSQLASTSQPAVDKIGLFQTFKKLLKLRTIPGHIIKIKDFSRIRHLKGFFNHLYMSQ